MSQPSPDASDLSNEEKKTTEPAPVIVREDKRRYLYEGALIIIPKQLITNQIAFSPKFHLSLLLLYKALIDK